MVPTGKTRSRRLRLIERAFLIDECLSAELVARAKAFGFEADYVPHIGKGGWQDWNLVPFAIEHDYIIVTLNRRDFLKQYAAATIHPGLVILMPRAPNDRRLHQAALFESALATFRTMNEDLVNKIIEVFEDGRVGVRTWPAKNDE